MPSLAVQEVLVGMCLNCITVLDLTCFARCWWCPGYFAGKNCDRGECNFCYGALRFYAQRSKCESLQSLPLGFLPTRDEEQIIELAVWMCTCMHIHMSVCVYIYIKLTDSSLW